MAKDQDKTKAEAGKQAVEVIRDAIETVATILQKFHDLGWPDLEDARAKLAKANALLPAP
jgi:hypothetical protein